MEALSQGRSVVVGKHGGLLEIIADGETGLVVTPGDARDLTDKIVLLLRDTDLRRRIGEPGWVMVLRCFTAERMVQELENSYLEVVGAGGNVPPEGPRFSHEG